MFLHELVGTEQHPVYQEMAAENLTRQYSFLRSVIIASIPLQQGLSNEVIKALNYHAISCLHTNAGDFRPCAVQVGQAKLSEDGGPPDVSGVYRPPEHFQVPALMQMFTNQVNLLWGSTDPVALAAFVLWRLNQIHPFINGNGRTARAACYLVLCLRAGGWLPGSPILPELIRRDRDEYVLALKAADAAALTGTMDLSILHAFLSRLIEEQLATAPPPEGDDPVPDPISAS